MLFPYITSLVGGGDDLVVHASRPLSNPTRICLSFFAKHSPIKHINISHGLCLLAMVEAGAELWSRRLYANAFGEENSSCKAFEDWILGYFV